MTIEEEVARLICERLGYDPDATFATYGKNNQFTTYYWQTYSDIASSVIRLIHKHLVD